MLLKREQQSLLETNKDEARYDNAFVDGLCAMLRGMNAATSRHVVSSPMAHLITSLDGARFKYSHEFVNLLVTQLDATLGGLPVNARIRKKQKQNWGDSFMGQFLSR